MAKKVYIQDIELTGGGSGGEVAWDDITDKPNFADVASSGDYEDLDNKPDLNTKQDTLVSGENIKTINNQSLLGSGNIDIQGGSGTDDYLELINAPLKRVSGGSPTEVTATITCSTNEEFYNAMSSLPMWDENAETAWQEIVNTGGYQVWSDFNVSSWELISPPLPQGSYLLEDIGAANPDRFVEFLTSEQEFLTLDGTTEYTIEITYETSGTYWESTEGNDLKIWDDITDKPDFSNMATKNDIVTVAGDLSTLTTEDQTNLVNAINEVYEKCGEPFRVKQWQSNTLNAEIPYCTEDISNTSIPKLTFSIDAEEGALYQIVGMIAYEVFDAESGGSRINCWPVCQFTGNGQKELGVRFMCAGTSRKTAKRISAWVLLKRRA